MSTLTTPIGKETDASIFLIAQLVAKLGGKVSVSVTSAKHLAKQSKVLYSHMDGEGIYLEILDAPPAPPTEISDPERN